jgi:hypothetical protein
MGMNSKPMSGRSASRAARRSRRAVSATGVPSSPVGDFQGSSARRYRGGQMLVRHASLLLVVPVAFGAFAACGQPSGSVAEPGPPSGPTSGPSTTGERKTVTITIPSAPVPSGHTPPHAWPAAVPPRGECSDDADCTVVVSAPVADPCCDATVTAEPIARRFLAFVTELRARECAGVRCPPGELPGAELAPCGYEGRCVQGRCANACGAGP